MAAQASQVNSDLVDICRIHYVSDRMIFHRMAQSVSQRQNWRLVFLEVVLGEFDLAVENGHDMLGCQFLRRRVWPVAFQAKGIAFRAEEMIIVATVWHMASSAALSECRLVVHGFLRQVGNVAVAAEADVYCVCFRKARLPAGMRVVTVGAIARCSRMLHFGGLDELGFIVVAGNA